MKIPVIANGGIQFHEDIQRCLDTTKADGVMVAEGILENPQFFINGYPDMDDMALEYMSFAKTYKAEVFQIKGHLFKFMFQEIAVI